MVRFNLKKDLATLLWFAVAVGSVWYAFSYVEAHKGELLLALEKVVREAALPYHIALLSLKPETVELPVPVYGVPLSEVEDTWGFARSEGRSHEGTDIFAPTGTPVFSVTEGYVFDTYFGHRGGNNVMVIGPGGIFYYYAHFERLAMGIERGQYVTPDTVLGYVGVSGNASGTPPHLHFGIYTRPWEAKNPYPYFIERWGSSSFTPISFNIF